MEIVTTSVAAVALRAVTAGYDARPVLRDVDLDIAPGEVVALLGPNGSGKSTLVRAVLGLVPVLTGSIELFGVPSGQFRDRARIGYVPQRDTVGGGIPATVEEVVASGRLGRRRLIGPMLPAHDRGVVAEAIATVGLTDKTGQTVTTLSGGQQRRTLIARALAGEPDLLIMDEPLAGVDLPNIEILVTTLTGLVSRGVTVVLVTHELGPVADLVRRAVVLRHGQIDYDGAPQRVTAVPSVDPHGQSAGADPDLGIQRDITDR